MIPQLEEAQSLALPRALVQQLLHQAQVARDGTMQALLVRHHDGSLGLQLVSVQAEPGELQRICAEHADEPYAFCSSPPSLSGEPSAADLRRWRGSVPVFLTVTLGTKGVLQLRAWKDDGTRLRALELKLHDLGGGL